MLNKIENRSAEAVMAFIKDAEEMINKYGWQDKTVTPYSFPVKVTKIIDDLKDYTRCTEGSQDYLISLANGLPRILNKWEEYENTPKIKVKIKKSGKIIEICEDELETFSDLVEVI